MSRLISATRCQARCRQGPFLSPASSSSCCPFPRAARPPFPPRPPPSPPSSIACSCMQSARASPHFIVAFHSPLNPLPQQAAPLSQVWTVIETIKGAKPESSFCIARSPSLSTTPPLTPHPSSHCPLRRVHKLSRR
jgi:hypothetical protein